MFRKLWVGIGMQLLAMQLTVTPALAAEDPGREAFSAGVALLQDPDGARYDEALPLFQRAYALTKSWKVLGNLGLCYMKLERYGDAIAAYEQYLREGQSEIEAEEQQQIGRDLATMRAQKVTLRITLVGAATAQLRDERRKPTGGSVSNDYALGAQRTLLVAPGDHVLLAESAGVRRELRVQLEPGSEVTQSFDFTAAGTPTTTSAPRPSRLRRSSPAVRPLRSLPARQSRA